MTLVRDARIFYRRGETLKITVVRSVIRSKIRTEVPHVVRRQSTKFICLGDPARCIRATLLYGTRGRVHSLSFIK